MSQTLSPSFARHYGLARVARVAKGPGMEDKRPAPSGEVFAVESRFETEALDFHLGCGTDN